MSPPSRQKPTALSPSEADIITNQALLNYAEASRIAKSWLSGFPASNGQDDEQEEEKEAAAEREILKNRDQYSDTGGIGYHASTASESTSIARPDSTTTKFLRKHLLGRRGGAQSGVNGQRYGATAVRSHAQQSRGRPRLEDNSDEEESRASVGKKRDKDHNKNPSTAASLEQAPGEGMNGTSAQTKQDGNDEPRTEYPPQPAATGTLPKESKKRGSSSYLDELLASRAAKKKKKPNSGKKDTS
jgi:hypothetical protein